MNELKEILPTNSEKKSNIMLFIYFVLSLGGGKKFLLGLYLCRYSMCMVYKYTFV